MLAPAPLAWNASKRVRPARPDARRRSLVARHRRCGRGTVADGLPAGGARQTWRMRRDLLSALATTRWDELLRV